jgi:hypothetical protein
LNKADGHTKIHGCCFRYFKTQTLLPQGLVSDIKYRDMNDLFHSADQPSSLLMDTIKKMKAPFDGGMPSLIENLLCKYSITKKFRVGRW